MANEKCVWTNNPVLCPQGDVMNCNKAFPERSRWLEWRVCPVCLTNLPEFDKTLRLSSSCRRPLLFPLYLPPHPLKVSKSLYPLLISPQASIFVPHFISFTLSLSLHLSPLSPAPVVMLSVGPGRIPRSTVSVALRGWGLKRKDSFLSTSHRA